MRDGVRRTIRPAGLQDVDALLRLEEGAFASDRLDRRAFRHAMRSATMSALVSVSREAVAGYVILQYRRGSGVARLTSIAVGEGAAGQGIGRALLEAAESAARDAGCDRVRLEVRADNDAARRLYGRCAYQPFAEVADYYEDGAAAVRYEKRLA